MRQTDTILAFVRDNPETNIRYKDFVEEFEILTRSMVASNSPLMLTLWKEPPFTAPCFGSATGTAGLFSTSSQDTTRLRFQPHPSTQATVFLCPSAWT